MYGCKWWLFSSLFESLVPLVRAIKELIPRNWALKQTCHSVCFLVEIIDTNMEFQLVSHGCVWPPPDWNQPLLITANFLHHLSMLSPSIRGFVCFFTLVSQRSLSVTRMWRVMEETARWRLLRIPHHVFKPQPGPFLTVKFPLLLSPPTLLWCSGGHQVKILSSPPIPVKRGIVWLHHHRQTDKPSQKKITHLIHQVRESRIQQTPSTRSLL